MNRQIRGCFLAGACSDVMRSAFAGINLPGAYLDEKVVIPARWLERLEARETIERLADLMSEASV